MSDLILRGERVVLRTLVDDDLPVLLAIMLQPEVAAWWPGYDLTRLRADTLEDPPCDLPRDRVRRRVRGRDHLQ